MPFFPSAMPTTHGTNSTPFRGTIVWNQLPSSIKSSRLLLNLKPNLKELRKIDSGIALSRK